MVPLTNVIAICIALVTAAVSIGVTFGKLATVLEKIKGLEKSRDLARDRFERIDRKLAALDAVRADRQQRRLTQPNQQAIPEKVNEERSAEDD